MTSRTSLASRAVTEVDVKKPPKEITVIQDQGFFQHSTGDTYNGSFEIKKKERTLKMHGPGEYKTAEGDIYTGTWENDKLGTTEDVSVHFVDTSTYEGSFKDWCFSGKGKYIYPDGSSLLCDFVENMPTGHLTLIDPNGHTWLGKAEQGFGWFEPINHYYSMLETTRESSKKRRDREQKQLLKLETHYAL